MRFMTHRSLNFVRFVQNPATFPAAETTTAQPVSRLGRGASADYIRLNRLNWEIFTKASCEACSIVCCKVRSMAAWPISTLASDDMVEVLAKPRLVFSWP